MSNTKTNTKTVNTDEFGLSKCKGCNCVLLHTSLNKGICDYCFLERNKK